MNEEMIISPIQIYNAKIKEAAVIARKSKGLVLAGQMLDQLTVVAIMYDTHLILKPNKDYFYNAMKKREAKILEAIKLVCPNIDSIGMIKGKNV